MKTKPTFTRTLLGGSLAAAVLAAALVAAPAPAWAGSSKSPKACARKEMTSAKSDVGRARGTMQRRALAIRKEFEARPEWKAAFADLKKAQTEYNAACRPALAAARTSAEYKAIQAREKQARSALSAVRVAAFTSGGNPTGGAGDIKALLVQMKELETAAIESDTKASAAKVRLDECQATVDGLKSELDAALAADSAWASAKQEVESCEARLASAQGAYASAVTAEKQQRVARRQAEIARIQAMRSSAPS